MLQRKLFFNLLLFGLCFGSLKVEKYRLSCNIQDRYVQSEIAVHVINTGNEDIEYDFGVKLDENEFISGLTMRVGDKGNYLVPGILMIKMIFFILRSFCINKSLQKT